MATAAGLASHVAHQSTAKTASDAAFEGFKQEHGLTHDERVASVQHRTGTLDDLRQVKESLHTPEGAARTNTAYIAAAAGVANHEAHDQKTVIAAFAAERAHQRFTKNSDLQLAVMERQMETKDELRRLREAEHTPEGEARLNAAYMAAAAGLETHIAQQQKDHPA